MPDIPRPDVHRHPPVHGGLGAGYTRLSRERIRWRIQLPDITEGLDYSKRPVPVEGRMPAFALTWLLEFERQAWIVIATTLASAYGTRNALIGLILTVLSYGAINFFIARYAIRTGLSVSLFLEFYLDGLVQRSRP